MFRFNLRRANLDNGCVVAATALLFGREQIPRFDPMARALKGRRRVRLENYALARTKAAGIHERVITLRQFS